MRLYEVQATEYNGEQEYSQSKLLAAENIDRAWQIARDYFRQWYDDGDEPEEHNTDNPDEFEFLNGCIRLRIDSITETTLERWKQQQVLLHSIGKLPITKSAHKKCQALLAVCEHIRDSLDVGGEQSRQFAEEIKMLKDALKTAPTVDDSCPKCGAGCDEREFTGKDFLDIEAIHMHYICKKCGSQITEEFTLSDVFIDNGR